MGNKRSKSKKPKQGKSKAGKKGGQMDVETFGSPSPVRKQKKRK